MEIPPPIPTSQRAVENHNLMKAAKKLETSFLAEMLKAAGYAEGRKAHGGGVGESQFSSFLIDAQAERMVEAGGIGLAHQIYEQLKDRNNVG